MKSFPCDNYPGITPLCIRHSGVTRLLLYLSSLQVRPGPLPQDGTEIWEGVTGHN